MSSSPDIAQGWLGRRAHIRHLHGHKRVSGQRRLALWMTIFAAIRTVAWILAMFLIVFHWVGLKGPFLDSFTALSSAVIFVTFISFYCNASTDAANFTASIAALFSADAHHDAETTRQVLTGGTQAIEDDIARLADLQPGPEATQLAAEIRQRLTKEA